MEIGTVGPRRARFVQDLDANPPTKAEYLRALREVWPDRADPDADLSMLRLQVQHGGGITATEMAHGLSYSDVLQANGRYGRLGRAVADALGIRSRTGRQWYLAISRNGGSRADGEGAGHFIWQMRPQFESALRAFGPTASIFKAAQKGASQEAAAVTGTTTRVAAGVKSAATKGEAEFRRAALMATWTRLYDKDDAANPYSKDNFNHELPALAPDAPLPPPDEPTAIEDARVRIMQAIVAREGQGAFRGAVVAAYDGRCAVTGCAEVHALEAAHIHPYLGLHTNGVTNGLLLRADLHTLFDKRLLSFDVDLSWPPTVVVSPEIEEPNYRNLNGTSLRLPDDTTRWPNRAALSEHCKSCRW